MMVWVITALSISRAHRFQPLSQVPEFLSEGKACFRGCRGYHTAAPTRFCREGGGCAGYRAVAAGRGWESWQATENVGPRVPAQSTPAWLPASSVYSLSPESSPWSPPPPVLEAAASPPWRPRSVPRRNGVHMDSAPGPAPSPQLPGSQRPVLPLPTPPPPGVGEEQLHGGCRCPAFRSLSAHRSPLPSLQSGW